MDKNIDMLSAIELAMQAEEKAHNFYKEGADKTDHPRGKDLFLQLADFEKNHYEHLKKLHEALSGTGQYIRYGGTSFRKSEGEVKGEVGGELNKNEVLEILNMAIEAEREAQERYTHLAEQTSDPSGQEMFKKLSEEESVHLRILNDEYYNIANQGAWSSKSLWSE